MEHQTECPVCQTVNRWSDIAPPSDRKCTGCGQLLTQQSTGDIVKIFSEAGGIQADDVLLLTCQLCRSQVMVDCSRTGGSVKCPDCHSPIQVVAPEATEGKQKFWSRNKDHDLPSIMGPDDEFKLSDPVNRPKIDYGIDPSWGLDPVTDDLLSASAEQEVVEAEAVDGTPEVDAAAASHQRSRSTSSRKQTDASGQGVHDQDQRRLQMDDRKQLRRQALKQAKKWDKSKLNSGLRFGLGGKFSRKRREHVGADDELRNSLAAAFGIAFSPALLVGWLMGAACWAGGYTISQQFGTLTLVDRLLDPHQETLPWREAMAFAVVAIGSLIVWRQCGMVFRDSFETASANKKKILSAHLFSDIVLFGFPWLVAGLPFLFFFAWSLPLQFLLLPFLLCAEWRNQSAWLVAATWTSNERSEWRSVFGPAAVLAALAIVPSAMLHAGGLWAIPGAILIVLLLTTLAIICGGHCRRLAKTIEPAA